MELTKKHKTDYEIFVKKESRMKRLQKILVLSSAYCHFAELTVSQSLLKSNNNYAQAENTSDFINNIFKQETSPSDFLHNKDELTNEIIEEYKSYKKWCSNKYEEYLGTNEKLINAFCKSVEFQNKAVLLKVDNTYLFISHISYLLRFLIKEIEKEDLEKILVDFSLFSGVQKKLSFKRFRKKIISIENLYQEIDAKQKSRTNKKNHNGK